MVGKTAATAVLLAALLAAAPVAFQQPDRRYDVHGLVLRVDVAARRFFVSHDRVEGLMEAMTMPFEVRDAGQLRGVVPGAVVDFVLVLTKDAGYVASIKVQRDERAEPPPVAIGQPVPDFTLRDSAGQRVKLSSFAGKVVAMTFISTRCVLPEFCLRMANTFAVLQRRFSTVLGRDAQLLTVTFDPQRDTPEVLAAYAAQWKADPRGWQFLTGSVDEVRRVCGLFGMDALPDDGLLSHRIRTAIVGRDGRLVANVEGNRFTPEQLGDLLRSTLEP